MAPRSNRRWSWAALLWLVAPAAAGQLEYMYVQEPTRIVRISGTGQVSAVAEGLDSRALVLEANGTLEVAGAGLVQITPEGKVRVVDISRALVVEPDGKLQPQAMVVDGQGSLFIANNEADGGHDIIRFDSSGSWTGTMRVGPVTALVMGVSGNLIGGSPESGALHDWSMPAMASPTVIRITPDLPGSFNTLDLRGPPRDLAQTVAGLTTQPRPTNSLVKSLAFGPDGNYYASLWGIEVKRQKDEPRAFVGSAIAIMTPTGQVRKLTAGPRYIGGIALDAAGDLFVVGYEDADQEATVYFVSKTGEFFEFAKGVSKGAGGLVIGPKFRLDSSALGPEYWLESSVFGAKFGPRRTARSLTWVYPVLGGTAAVLAVLWFGRRRRIREKV